MIVDRRLLMIKRAMSGFTQKYMAEKMNITLGSYSNKERGIFPFTLREIKIAKRELKLTNDEVIEIYITPIDMD